MKQIIGSGLESSGRKPKCHLVSALVTGLVVGGVMGFAGGFVVNFIMSAGL